MNEKARKPKLPWFQKQLFTRIDVSPEEGEDAEYTTVLLREALVPKHIQILINKFVDKNDAARKLREIADKIEKEGHSKGRVIG